MNKSYRSIWNESLGAWVATSEITRARGKASCSRTTAGSAGTAWRLNSAASAVALALGLLAPMAQATVAIDGAPVIGTGTTGVTCAQPAVGSVWTCQIPRAGGGFATITGITGANGGAAITNANAWATANPSAINAIVMGTQTSKVLIGGTAGTGNGAVAIGDGAQAAESSVAVGVRAVATHLTSTALGFETKAAGQYSVALGSGAQAVGDVAYALGNNALARKGDVAVGAGALTNSEVSAAATLAGRVGETTAIGYNAGLTAKDVYRSTFVGSSAGAASKGELNSFVGHATGASTTGNRNAYFGNNAGAQVSGSFNVASGNYALANLPGALASDNVAQGNGAGAVVTGDRNVAIGRLAGSKATLDSTTGDPTGFTGATYSDAVNIGSATQAFANGAVAVGAQSAAAKVGGVAVGQGAVASGERGAALGAGATASNDFATALGNGAKALGGHTVAVGVDANASGLGATAIGRSATAAAERGTALGADTSVAATAVGGVALGQSSLANTAAGVIGLDSTTGAAAAAGSAIANTVGTLGAVSVGNATNRRQITNLAAGSVDTDAVNVAQLKAAQTHYYSVNSTNKAAGSNYANDGAVGPNSLASGVEANSLGSISIAIGNQAKTAATANNSIAIGNQANTIGNFGIALGDQAKVVGGSFATAIGLSAQAAGNSSIAVGRLATAGNPANATQMFASIAIGDQSKAHGRSTIALGEGAIAGVAGSTAIANAIAIGNGAQAVSLGALGLGSGSRATVANGVALGSGSVADTDFGVAGYNPQGATPAGATWNSTLAAVSVGSAGNTRQITNLAAGAADTDAVNVAQLKAGQVHYFSVQSNNPADANYDNKGASGVDAIAIGKAARVAANSPGSVAMGLGATVDNKNFGASSVAIGNGAQDLSAVGGAVVIGNNAKALGNGSNFGGNQTVIGNGATSTSEWAGALAIGAGATVSSTKQLEGGQLAIGSGNVTASGQGSMAVGFGSTATGFMSTAIGNDLANASGASSMAIGGRAVASGQGSIALGGNGNAVDAYGGVGAQADGKNSVAIGTKALASVENGVALGSGSVASTGALVAGYNPLGATPPGATWNSTLAAVSVGSAGNTRQITNVAAGAVDTDAVNVAQLKAVSAAAAAGDVHYFSVQSNNPADGNYNNKGATGTDAIAIGKDASATGVNSVAMGRQTTAGSNEATAIGFESKALGQSSTAMGYQSNAFGTHSISLGYMSAANNNGTALGTAAKALGTRSTAVGTDSKALGQGGVALGDQANAVANGAVALGYLARAAEVGSVALGSNSVTAAANPTASVVVDGTTYNFAGITPASVVSVGSVNAERQVTNVAAGRISGTSTDAINGSQLYATNKAVDTLGDQAVRYTINPDGTVNYNSVTLNPGGAGPTTISNVAAGVAPTDAVNVSQLTTVANTANKGWNLSANGEATPQNIAPGGTVDFANGDNIEISRVGNKITVATAKDVSFDSVTTGDTVMNNGGITVGKNVALGSTGLTIVGGPSVTTSGIDAGNQFITNVKAGVNPTDGVNVSQLTSVSTEAGKGWQLQANGDTSSKVAPGDTVQFIDGKNIRITRTGGNVTVATADDVAFNSVVVGTTVISSGNVQVGPNVALGSTGLTIVGGPSVTIAGIDAGNQYITNVKAGVNATDGVNVSQLTTAVSGASNKWVTGSQTTTYVAPSATGPESTAMGSGSSASGANSTAVGTGAVASVNNSVALGNGSTTTAATPTASTTIRGTTYDFAGANPAGVVSVGSVGAERQIQNVAAGQISIGSTDAINGSQLYATNLAIESISAVAGAGINVTTAATGTGIAIGTSVANVGPGGTATYTAGNNMVLTQNGTNTTFAVNDNPNFNSVTVGGTSITQSGINAGGNVISNVAPGVAGTDAVNVNQLNSASAANNAYTDARVNGLGNEVRGIAKNAYAGVAAAMAVQMPGSYVPGKTVMRIGGAVFKGESAVGVSFRRTAENNGWSLTGGVGLSRAGAAVTAGVEWVFN